MISIPNATYSIKGQLLPHQIGTRCLPLPSYSESRGAGGEEAGWGPPLVLMSQVSDGVHASRSSGLSPALRSWLPQAEGSPAAFPAPGDGGWGPGLLLLGVTNPTPHSPCRRHPLHPDGRVLRAVPAAGGLHGGGHGQLVLQLRRGPRFPLHPGAAGWGLGPPGGLLAWRPSEQGRVTEQGQVYPLGAALLGSGREKGALAQTFPASPPAPLQEPPSLLRAAPEAVSLRLGRECRKPG